MITDYMSQNLPWASEWLKIYFEIIVILAFMGIFTIVFLTYRHRISIIPYVLMVISTSWAIYGVGWYLRHALQYTWIQWLATQWEPLALILCTVTFSLFAFQLEKIYWGLRVASFMVGFCLPFPLWIGVYVFVSFYPIWATFDWFHMGLLVFPLCLLYYGVVKHRKGRWLLAGVICSVIFLFLLYWLVTVTYQTEQLLNYALSKYSYDQWIIETGGGGGGGVVVPAPSGGVMIISEDLLGQYLKIMSLASSLEYVPVFMPINLSWAPEWYQTYFEIINVFIVLVVFAVVYVVLRQRVSWKPYLLMVASASWMVCGVGWYLRHCLQYTWVQWFAIQWCPLAFAFCTIAFGFFAFRLEKTYWGLRIASLMVGFCLGFALWIGMYVFVSFYPIWATFDWFHMGLLVFPLCLMYYGVVKHRKGRWLLAGVIMSIMYISLAYWLLAVPNGWNLPQGYYKYYMYLSISDLG